MSKYAAKTEEEILDSVPVKNGIVAISTDTKKIFVSYNGEWNYRKFDSSNDRSSTISEGMSLQEIKKSEDGFSSVMGLSSGYPVGWWKSTDVLAKGEDFNLVKKSRVSYWKSLISDYAFVIPPNGMFGSYGGQVVYMDWLTGFPG